MITQIKYYCIIIFLAASFTCEAQSKNSSLSIINTSHLDYLYQEINVSGKSMGIIHIYSDYPEYKWIDDDDEGTACVDDAARAAQFYMKHFDLTGEKSSYEKAEKLLQFLLFMQADNGYFYNFIWGDYSINKTFKTSVAEPNWWTWRAIAALSDGYQFFQDRDVEFASVINNSLSKVITVLKSNLPVTKETRVINGLLQPTWLPSETASDQAALLLIGLISYSESVNDSIISDYIKDLSEGILLMQAGDAETFPFGAFLSWQNLWHAYGNLQSYALLKSFEFSNSNNAKDAALLEINHFYNYLTDNNYLNEFTLNTENNISIAANKKTFSQIAYGIRPMVYACLMAYEVTNDTVYAEQAGVIAAWLLGNNIAKKQMYNNENGMCYDGINSETNINLNSGAESTIEALLTIIAIEQNSISKRVFNNFSKSNFK
ncbi:MAG: hypothetical protein L3J41_05325 [Melioribacteraceae bacterium]|nr:hypothetical protein [Melioribacteraceae bacterium]